jgi:hypothetical protein
LKFGVAVVVVQAPAVVWEALQADLVHIVKKLFRSFLVHVTTPVSALVQTVLAVVQAKEVALLQ